MRDIGERLEEVLKSLPVESVDVEVRSTSPSRVIGLVESPTFEGMEDHERQALVWRHILDHMDEPERVRVEFVFTDAPSETAAA